MTAVELPPIYTIGHSSRSIDEFVALLQVGSAGMVVDIRKTPRSRANPKFNIDALPDVLSVRQIDYSRIEEVAGRTAKSRTAPPWVDGFWTNRSFHNYADYGDAHVTVIIRDRASYSPDPFQESAG